MEYNKTKLKILYRNARSIVKWLEALQKILIDYDVFVCIETWLKPSQSFKVPGFSTFRVDRSQSIHEAGAGILFLVRNRFDVSVLKDLNSPNEDVEIAR